MRVMLFVKPLEESDMNASPTSEALKTFRAMDEFTEDLVKAGIFVAAAGLKPSAQSKRIVFEGSQATVIDGPFVQVHELVAGFSIWEVKDMNEAVTWAKRWPSPEPGRMQLEIRPFYETTDLANFLSPDEVSALHEATRGRLGVA